MTKQVNIKAWLRCIIAGHDWMPRFTSWYVSGFGETQVVVGYDCVKCGVRKKSR